MEVSTTKSETTMAISALSKFEFKKADDGYVLHIEDDSGDKIELTATLEQMDVISDALIEILEADDSAEESGDDEDED